jgi:ribose/xylose/arabinose/galactoside ABC-type transport system permease subunit
VIILGRIDGKRARTVIAWILLVGSLVGWPISMLTWARREPPFILSLSWLAIVIEAASLLTSSQVRENQDSDSE